MTVGYSPDPRVLLQKLITEAAQRMSIVRGDVRWLLVQCSQYAALAATDGSISGSSGSGGKAEVTGTGTGSMYRYAVTASAGVSRYVWGNMVGSWAGTTNPCFFRGRFATGGTPTATVNKHVGFQNSPMAHGVGIGEFGSVSLTNYVIAKVATSVETGVDTGIAIDTAMHKFMFSRNSAGAWVWQIDDGAVTSMTTTGQPTAAAAGAPHVMVTNAAVGVAGNLDLDFAFWAVRKPT